MSDLALPARPRRALTPTDLSVMAGRCVRLSRRQLDALLTSLMLPVMLMVTFVYLFGGAIDTGTRYVTYVVPGVITLCAAVGAAGTAVAVTQDLAGGIVDRFRSMDIGATALLAGHVVANVVRNLAAATVVFGVAFAIGFRAHAGLVAWLGVAGLLVAFLTALSWLCAAYGLLARSAESASACMFALMFVTYASSAFVPVRTMPGWLHAFAEHQPATPVIESLRGLLLHGSAGGNLVPALTWCGGILAVSMAACAVLFRRRTG